MNSSGCVLYNEHSFSPLYQLQEPLLLIQGMAASAQQVHLVMIKANGDLCYTLINGSGQNQTTVLDKLEVRTTRYRRLLLFPLGKTVHIFYAYSHQSIPNLWRIEHKFWNGKTWRSVNLGEVFHSREPLYDIVLDRGGNLHLLMMTFQGRQTLILTNRFNGSFYLWGNTSQTFQIQQEVLDITSIMTPDNNHHLFWLAKTPSGKFELGWAYRTGAQDFSGNWLIAPAALLTLSGPIKGLGAMEINGGLWLLINAEIETLLFYKGDGWKQVLSNSPTHRHLRYIRKNDSSYYNAYWLEESRDSRTPAYHQQLGLNFTSRFAQVNQTHYVPPIGPPTYTQSSPSNFTQQVPASTPFTPAYTWSAPTYNQSPPSYTQSTTQTLPQSYPPLIPQPINQLAYNTIQSPVPVSISTPPVITQPHTDTIPTPIKSPQTTQAPTILPEIQIEKQVESWNQPSIDYNLQFAYTDYPDDLIPPAPEISYTTNPSYQPAYIDQPVFATQPIATTQLEPLPTIITLVEEVISSTPTAAEPILQDSIPEQNSSLQKLLKLPSLQETLTTLETGPSVLPKKIPHEYDTGTFTIPNGAGAILETLTENSHINPPQSESDLNQKNNKSRTLKPKRKRKNSPPSSEINTGLITMTDSLPVFAPQRVSFMNHKRGTENLNQVLAPMITKTLDPILKTIAGLESQVSQLQNEKDMAWQKIEDYLNRIESEKEISLQKFEQQVNLLQQEEKTNHQKIERLISSLQLEKEEKAKAKAKGFWAEWFK